jgi:uncharacterized phage protein gp47/JayE
MSVIDETGFDRDRYQDVRVDIASRWTNAFPGRVTAPESVNGRIISTIAELEDQNNSKVQLLLDAFNPSAATGNLLSWLALLMAKRRRESVKSTVTLTMTAAVTGCTIPAGSIVSQSAGAARFVTLAPITLGASASGTVAAESVATGAVEAASGTLTQIDTPVYGWASVTNASDASIGQGRETDAQLRFRMLRTSSAGTGTVEGIETAIGEIDGVTYVRVIENSTDAVDANDLPPHSVMPVVVGGADAEIGAALLRTVAAGIDYTDDTDIPSADWVEVDVTNPSNGQIRTVWFARPVETAVAITLEIEVGVNFPSDGQERIKAAIVELVNNWDIGRTLFASRLYNAVNTVDDVDINEVEIDASDKIVLLPFEKLQIDDTDITITVV